jgi:ATP-dependent protease HslVU (ClpYQ) peptidase subunit
MKRARLGTAVAGVAACAVACALLWPHAREAGAILAAQDDPAVLSDVQLDSALRNNQALVAENIEAALAANDADLANSFVELAGEKGVPVTDELSRRVSDAVAEENSSSHLAKRFATGLVTGNADDFASLSGTVAGDLFWYWASPPPASW